MIKAKNKHAVHKEYIHVPHMKTPKTTLCVYSENHLFFLCHFKILSIIAAWGISPSSVETFLNIMHN